MFACNKIKFSQEIIRIQVLHFLKTFFDVHCNITLLKFYENVQFKNAFVNCDQNIVDPEENAYNIHRNS